MSRKVAVGSHPFSSDAEYLDAEAGYIRTRCSRIAAERAAGLAKEEEEGNEVLAHRPGRTSARATACRARELLAAEERLRAEIDGRLECTRATDFVLGIDKIVARQDLCDDQRLILIAAALLCIGQRVVDEVFCDLAFYGSASVEALCALLDPGAVRQWLAARRLFRTDGALIATGLLVLSRPLQEATPSTLMALDVRLSVDAFALIVGDPAVARELDPVPDDTFDP